MRILLGPLLFAMDVAPVNILTGVVFILVLLPAIASVALKPRVWTAAVSLLGLLIWVILGVIGAGIGC